MPEIMLFKEAIDSNSVPFTAFVGAEGHFDDGEWIPPTTLPINMTGVILPLTNDELNFAENGVYTTKEKKLLTVTPLSEGMKVLYKENNYTVEAFKDYSDYTDVLIYLMRWREK